MDAVGRYAAVNPPVKAGVLPNTNSLEPLGRGRFFVKKHGDAMSAESKNVIVLAAFVGIDAQRRFLPMSPVFRLGVARVAVAVGAVIAVVGFVPHMPLSWPIRSTWQ